MLNIGKEMRNGKGKRKRKLGVKKLRRLRSKRTRKNQLRERLIFFSSIAYTAGDPFCNLLSRKPE